MIAQEHATAKGRERTDLVSNGTQSVTTLDEAAKMYDVGRTTAARARRVATNAAPEVVDAVKQGVLDLSEAEVLITQPRPEQKKIAESDEAKAITAGIKQKQEEAVKRTNEEWKPIEKWRDRCTVVMNNIHRIPLPDYHKMSADHKKRARQCLDELYQSLEIIRKETNELDVARGQGLT